MSRVDVLGLECRMEELHRAGIIAVWPSIDHRQLQVLQHPEDVVALVVPAWKNIRVSQFTYLRGIVQQEDMILPEIGPRLLQPLHQLQEEDLHHVGVGVGLEQAEEDLPVGVEGGNHGDARNNLQLGHGVGRIGQCPLHLPKVTHTKPTIRNGNINENL